MSVNHRERLECIVDKTLKMAAVGEPYGFAVNGPAIWPLQQTDGSPAQPGPAWFVMVTIRSAGLGEPDIGNGFPVPGILPDDEHFRTIATALLERCRQERDQKNAEAFAAAGPSMKLTEKPG